MQLLDGGPEWRFTKINSSQGLTARLLSASATLASLLVKDRESNHAVVVFGLDGIKGSKEDNAYISRTIERVCNQIDYRNFVFDGKKYKLHIDCLPHILHSGPRGSVLVIFTYEYWLSL
ncbi:hypothetical protein OESDEN_16729 [Oesophagostomum dentatum]|uniref:Galactose mutarotase n=1 Tax=Oesophagostomum dentatum TaxID=61180 RepID=A0A0B1SI55_OESDE|nr:hypothetical protein OESDEN_16729 [Oesophagostomum dentatum]